MRNIIEAQLAGARSELARQDDQWLRTRRALAALGREPVAVPREFLSRLDALARGGARGDVGIRV
jgi:hypothetical protein